MGPWNSYHPLRGGDIGEPGRRIWIPEPGEEPVPEPGVIPVPETVPATEPALVPA